MGGGGNFPGDKFPGGQFSGEQFSGGAIFLGNLFPGDNFDGGIFPSTPGQLTSKNAVAAVISLHIVCLENPENQNSEITANTSEVGT